MTSSLTMYWTSYSGNNPYADFNVSTLTSRYLYGNAIDLLFARLNANPVTITWYLTDNLGTIRQLVDNGGMVQDTVTYGDSYGNNPSDSGTGDRFKFTGREYDAEIGLYYYRARYYDPGTGRFVSQDPKRFGAKDTNLYRYVTNTPTTKTDPSGNAWSWAGCIGGAATGGIIAGAVGSLGSPVVGGVAAVGGIIGGCLLGGFAAPALNPPGASNYENFKTGCALGVIPGEISGVIGWLGAPWVEPDPEVIDWGVRVLDAGTYYGTEGILGGM